jgi:Peptidase family M1 domain/Peptidase M1 N-terminal domain/Secretion system C-terminal sorting domain
MLKSIQKNTINMKKICILCSFCLCFFSAFAQPKTAKKYGCHFAHNHSGAAQTSARSFANNSRSDSFDILHYDIFLDISNYAAKTINGKCKVAYSPKIAGIQQFTLDLLGLTVDSIHGNDGTALAFQHQGLYLNIALPQSTVIGQNSDLTVWYHGTPIQSSSGFGGVYFEDNYIYNLSIGLNDDPHNFGHAWFPCFDNFRERSTYDFHLTTTLPFRAYSVGDLQSETLEANNKVTRHYGINLPVTSYQVSFAAANYAPIKRSHSGIYGNEYPLLLLAKATDTTATKTAFLPFLGDAIDCFETWYGPYNWSSVGYALTPRGAMENPGNTIYPQFLIEPANIESHLNIMAHELAHNWWGNVVTVGTEQDMWIKEGPAEYSSQLFLDYAFGKKEFINALKSNTYDVLRNAHYDDFAFLPLSPMPHEVTYGTHTYNKGAMVMHNLHSYLGDSLYQKGMTKLQTSMKYRNMSAAEFRDSLSAHTGYNLTYFFEDQVFSPGFTDFEINEVTISTNANGQFEASVRVQQKVRKAPHLYRNVPVEVTFRGQNGQLSHHKMIVSEDTTAIFSVPFEPKMTYLNTNQFMNLASLGYEKTVKNNGNITATNASFSITVKGVTPTDSAFIRIEHHWTKPDITPNLPADLRISNNHYWTFDGIWGSNFIGTGLVRFNKSTDNTELDADLVSITEDSLIVLYRPDGHSNWARFPRATILHLGSMTDGNGFARLDTMLRGEYAFANGELEAYSAVNQPIADRIKLNITPNPVQDLMTFSLKNVKKGGYFYQIIDALGRVVLDEKITIDGDNFLKSVEVNSLESGMYIMRIYDKYQNLVSVEKLEKI